VGGQKDDVVFYQKMAEELGLENRTLFLEKVNREKVALYQKSCDLLLMPFPRTNHFSYFMSPLKMFEYMASQRPIIVSDLPSVREVLNEQSCLFCESDNPRDLAEKIKTLINNPDLSNKLARNAHEDVQQYTWDRRARAILDKVE